MVYNGPNRKIDEAVLIQAQGWGGTKGDSKVDEYFPKEVEERQEQKGSVFPGGKQCPPWHGGQRQHVA